MSRYRPQKLISVMKIYILIIIVSMESILNKSNFEQKFHDISYI